MKPPIVTLKNGYVFDRRVFQPVIAFLFVTVALMFFKYGDENRLYVVCPADSRGPCMNPYKVGTTGFCTVNDERLCTIPTLNPGESWGEKPTWIIENWLYFVAGLLSTAFLLNHLIHNSGGKSNVKKPS